MSKYVLFNKGQPVHVTDVSPYTGTPKLKKFPGVEYDEVKDSRDYNSLAEVEDVAAKVTALTGELYLPYDMSENCSPRFGIFVPPKVGDKVSRAFNGDYYPAGEIVRVTKGWRITTSDGTVFNRKKTRPSWVQVGGTWSMVSGHISEQNPSF